MMELRARKEVLVKKSIAKADALKAFGDKGQSYKCELISELEDGHISTYTQGNFTDLCKGPHLLSTEPIKAVKVLRRLLARRRETSDDDAYLRYLVPEESDAG